ncbi:AEC family transporter [Acetanaerobacterium elongatum]|uniref:Transporter n=1 Tax=Acetanaerobacterium elongatum TaxID=258515 RepID=A0A1G9XA31_9FIRM|nr:AEC family transporter [Acetanaerobacterium elongatum]SDM93306.1 hypothetical protein SAMN05192585_1083 [Acetanaerobacterium elongatum]
MNQTLAVIQMVLPVLLMIGLGLLCRRTGLVSMQGLSGIKAVVANITLPVVLFKAFYSAQYNLNSLLTFAVIFISCSVALALGFVLRRLVGERYKKFMPFLLSGFEVGMLGYALFSMLAGDENLHVLASLDLGQVLFAYTVYLSLLGITSGNKPTPKGVVLNIFKNPACIGMLLGIIVGATGLGSVITGSAIGGIFTQAISFIAAPTAGMILIIVGYELSLSKKLLKPVFITIGLRLAVMALLLLAASALLFAILPFDKTLFMALLLIFSLPAPFVIPIFADVQEHGEYISTTVSVNTLVTVLIFAGIAVYAIS